MAERCNLNLNKKVLSKSSFFDKRFDKLKFLEDDKRAEVIVEVKEELLKLQEDGSTEEVTLERQPPEKKRFLGVGLSDSESEEGELASGGAAEEINKYK